jgi:cytochrome d ubiquinol oxidase subunit I
MNRFHEAGIIIALTIAGTASILQLVSGDVLARMVASINPTMLASLEGQFKTESGATLRIGRIA